MSDDPSLNGTAAIQRPDALPVGWAETTLGEAFRWGSGGTPLSSVQAYYDGEISWAIIGDLNDGIVNQTQRTITPLGLQNSSAKLIEPGHVLVAMYGSIGKLGISGLPMATNQAIAFTKPDPIDARYLFWYLRCIRDELFSLGKGGTQRNISQTVLKSVPFPVAPLPEQCRIVAEIETQFTRLDAAVAALERARANLKRYRAAVLEEAVAEGSAVFPDSGSAFEPLGDIAVRSEYGTSVKCSYDATNEPVLRIPNVARGQIDLSDMKYATRPLELQPESALRPGDLLMVRTNGSIDLVGRTAVINQPMSSPHGFASYLLRFRFNPVRVSAAWVHLYLSSPRGREFIERHAASSAGQHNVSLSLLGKMPIPLPSVGAQQTIVQEVERRFSIIEDIEVAIIANLKRAERFRQSILREAFAGHLVSQDPTDEPASVLLERIRAERAVMPRQRPKTTRRSRAGQPSLF